MNSKNKKRNSAPCYMCEERHENCHSECEKYQEYKATMNKMRDAREKEQALETYIVDAARRMKTHRY